jgi:hypothetical protein
MRERVKFGIGKRSEGLLHVEKLIFNASTLYFFLILCDRRTTFPKINSYTMENLQQETF